MGRSEGVPEGIQESYAPCRRRPLRRPSGQQELRPQLVHQLIQPVAIGPSAAKLGLELRQGLVISLDLAQGEDQALAQFVV